MSQVKKAVIPVAGLGTRMLPATKAIPKEMLPVVDKPLIQYAIDAVKEADCFDEIWVNSDGEPIREIAINSGVNFYKRPAYYASDEASNDEFTEDFFNKVKEKTGN